MIECHIDSIAFEAAMRHTIREIEAASIAALDKAAAAGLATKLEKVQRTYDRPVPTGKSGKPKWRRSGAWRDGQKVTRPGHLVRAVVDSGKAAAPLTNYPGGYAERLAELPTGRDGINRSNAAAADALPEIERDVQTIFEAELTARLGRT